MGTAGRLATYACALGLVLGISWGVGWFVGPGIAPVGMKDPSGAGPHGHPTRADGPGAGGKGTAPPRLGAALPARQGGRRRDRRARLGGRGLPAGRRDAAVPARDDR